MGHVWIIRYYRFGNRGVMLKSWRHFTTKPLKKLDIDRRDASKTTGPIVGSWFDKIIFFLDISFRGNIGQDKKRKEEKKYVTPIFKLQKLHT